jgi:two-component system, NarL family, response regulator DevR
MNNAMGKIKVLLVDDHEIVRLGLTTLLNDRPDLMVVGEAGTSAEAMQAVERHRPDVILMDIRIPGAGGIETTRLIRERYDATKVVILSSYANDELVIRAIQAGAVGYVLKQVGNEELLRAIFAAARGEALLDPTITTRLLSHVRENQRKADQEAFRVLSGREIDVLIELSTGQTNQEIAARLNLSEKTARNYVSTILEKLHLTNRTELAAYAVEHHIRQADQYPPDPG